MQIISSLTLAASLLSAVALAADGIQMTFEWKMDNVSSSGLKDITFPMSIADSPHKHGFYYAQQYRFHGVDQLGYTGLQPQADSDGSSVIRAVFSTFADGSKSSDKQCSSGADGSSDGVSCSVTVQVASYDHPYNLVVKNTDDTTWTGTLVDTVSHNSTHIGSYTLPKNVTGIKGYEQGFLEYFPFNSGGHSCDELPFGNVTYGAPFSHTPGAGSSSLTKPSGYGDCGKKTPPKAHAVGKGYQVSVGA